MYLGYIEVKNGLYYNPGVMFWNKEILFDSDFHLLNRHYYLDSLLGYNDPNPTGYAHIHPNDLSLVQNMKNDFHETGYFEKTVRLLCDTGTDEVKWLITLSKVYPFISQSGEMVLVGYGWPFAFTNDVNGNFSTDKDITGNLEFIKNNEAWMTLVPSFFNPLIQPSIGYG